MIKNTWKILQKYTKEAVGPSNANSHYYKNGNSNNSEKSYTNIQQIWNKVKYSR